MVTTTTEKAKREAIPESSSLAKPEWSLSLAIATTRTNFASGNVISIVSAKALADSLVCAGRQKS